MAHRRRKSSNPLVILILLIAVGVMIYFSQVVVPTIPPLFVDTPIPTRSPDSYVQEAQQLVAEGKYVKAIASYQESVRIDPGNVAVYIELARTQIYLGQYTDAAESASNAILINPNNPMGHAVKGWALGLNGNYLEGQASLQEALNLDPNNAQAYAYLAEVLALADESGTAPVGTMDKAIEASRTAERLSPDSLETHRARGLVLEQTQNTEEAITQYKAAIAINPNIADLHIALGRNLLAMGRSTGDTTYYNEAINEFNQAATLTPEDPMPLVYISRAHAAVGEYARAIQYAERAVELSPADAFMYGNLGTMYYRNREYDKSVEPLRLAVRGGTASTGESVQGTPLDYGRAAEYYYLYGLALARTGQCSESIQISQQLQKGVANDEIAVYNAQEMVNICQESAGKLPTITPQPTAEGGTPTP